MGLLYLLINLTACIFLVVFLIYTNKKYNQHLDRIMQPLEEELKQYE